MNISKNKIEILLARQQITKKELANKMGISTTGLREALKKGRANPVTVGKMAKAFEVEIEDIIVTT